MIGPYYPRILLKKIRDLLSKVEKTGRSSSEKAELISSETGLTRIYLRAVMMKKYKKPSGRACLNLNCLPVLLDMDTLEIHSMKLDAVCDVPISKKKSDFLMGSGTEGVSLGVLVLNADVQKGYDSIKEVDNDKSTS